MNKIIPFLLLLIILLVTVTSFVTVAEYSDIDSNAVLTFNQQVKNGNFVTSDGWQSYNNASFSISNFEISINAKQFGGVSQAGLRFYTHKYYLSVDSYGSSDSDTLTINLSYNPQITFDLSTSYQTYDTVFTITSFGVDYGNAVYIVTTIDSVVFLRNFYIIDLTLMFGAGNEPDLEECRSLFTSEYYPYSTGTALTFNGVNSYQQGFTDGLNSLSYDLTSSYFNQSGYGINFNDYRAAFSNTGNSDEFRNSFSFSGYCVLPFGSSLSDGTVLQCSIILLDFNGGFDQFDVGILYGGQFISLYSISSLNDDPDNITPVNFSITLPYNSDGLVLFAGSNEGPSVQDYYSVLVSDFTVSYRTYNFNTAVENSYDSGYKNGSIVGYNQGYKDAILKTSQGEFTFTGLLSSVIEAPVNVLIGKYDDSTGSRIGGLFNFDFLGYNMSTFLMSLFSLAVIICIARVFV